MPGLAGFLLVFPIFIAAVMVHEVSHGWVALRLGDPTAKAAGRLTFNPIQHIDPLGTVALPLALLLLNAPFLFGWARPVPINPMYFRHPKKDLLWVGAAGPAANFLTAFAGALLLKGLDPVLPIFLTTLIRYGILVNLVLGTFNLLPIPPLDGSRVLAGLLPSSWARGLLGLERWGIVIVILLLYAGFLDRVLWPIVLSLSRLLGVGG